jgi:hypothetical protein
MEKIEITETDNLLIYKKGYSTDFIRKTIGEKKLNGLFVYDVLDPLPSLDFLKECSFLKGLRLNPVKDHDYSFLRDLTNLKYLFIGSSETNKQEIDLSRQTNLVDLSITWRKHISGLEYCRSLEILLLIEFKEKDLSILHKVPALKKLAIKTSSVKTLAGVEICRSIESIFLGNCRSLTSIDALNHLPALRTITLDACTKIDDYEELNDLPALEELEIMNCNSIPSIQFIMNIPSLKKMILGGNTQVADGNLKPILGVKKVFYANHSQYNIQFPPPNWKKYVHEND